MRSLKFSDLFTFTKIIKKMNIRDEIKGLVTDVTGKSEEERANVQSDIQINLMLLFIEHIGDAEQEVYKLLADVTEKSTTEIGDLKITDVMEIIKDIFNDPQFEDFFEQALNFTK